MALTLSRSVAPASILTVGAVLALLPLGHLTTFHESFLYLIFFWVALATSWNILGGYTHYISFGHAAFFGVGMYATATLAGKFAWPFLWTLPAAGLVAAALALGIGAIVFRLNQLRGELFALLTMAVAFVVGTIVLNTPIDGGLGVYLSSVALPRMFGSSTLVLYYLLLGLAVGAVLLAYWIAGSRFGFGLFAIADDEDVAEVKGVPTFRYKMIAFAISAAIAGMVGGVHALYVGYVTVGETFGITVPLYVVLMSIIGGARHWLGPVVGAVIITVPFISFLSGDQAMIGRALVACGLIVVILALPDGIVPTVLRRLRRKRVISAMAKPEITASDAAPDLANAPVILECREVRKSFGGIQALRGVSLQVRRGEIVGLVGANGSGKTTLINMISGHFRLDGGAILLDGEAIGGRSANQVARRGVARTYQIPRPFAHMTALDNVALSIWYGTDMSDADAVRAEAMHWLAFTGLGEKADSLPEDLNLHERKLLELARALAAKPKLLLLDEVLSGLNPTEVDGAMRLIRQIRARGTTIVFVEHLMRAVVGLSDRIVVLNQGEVLACGNPQDVMRNPDVVSLYLGKSHAA